MRTDFWVDEVWRLLAGMFIALVAGFITGYKLLFLVFFLVPYAAWMIYRFKELETWLRSGGSQELAPDAIGIASEIMQLIHRDRKSNDRKKNRLRASLSRFNDMAAELPDAIIVLNESMQIIWSNASAANLLGIIRKKDSGQRIDNLIRVPEFHQFLNDPDRPPELELASPVNSQLTIALHLTISADAVILTGRDVTQRVAVREMRKAFVADVSHELRTPLTVIQGYMELVIDDPTVSGETRKALESVTSQAARMSNIVDDLLTLSKLESSSLEASEGENINLSTMLKAVLDEAAHRQHRGYTFKTDIDESVTLFAKQNEIYSACQNLVQNALKYTPMGTTITLSWLRQEGGAALIVADDGPGISREHLPRLSERFYRVDKARSRETGGTGLGLAIVKYIMQRHGGQLSISSEPGEGSNFTLLFPPERLIC